MCSSWERPNQTNPGELMAEQCTDPAEKAWAKNFRSVGVNATPLLACFWSKYKAIEYGWYYGTQAFFSTTGGQEVTLTPIDGIKEQMQGDGG